MRNRAITSKNIAIVSTLVLLISFVWLTFSVGATKGWAAMVHAPLKSAQHFDWSAPDEFFTGRESGKIKFIHQSDSFKGVVMLRKFKQAGLSSLGIQERITSSLKYDLYNPLSRVRKRSALTVAWAPMRKSVMIRFLAPPAFL